MCIRDRNTYAYARQYAMCVIVFGGVPTVLSNVLSNLIRSIGMSRQASTGIILGGLLNIALDPLFMFVLLPKGSEVLGAGIATCLSNCVAFLYFASVSYTHLDVYKRQGLESSSLFCIICERM